MNKSNWKMIRLQASLCFFLLILFLSGFQACNFINPEEGIPSFISVDTFKLSTINYSQGPDNHNITDIWLSVNGDIIGVFELPVKIPVLQTGDANLYINAGIKNNGIAASRVKYPFYTQVQIDTVLYPDQTLHLVPHVEYRPETVFDWFENFEDPGISFDTTSLSDVAIGDTVINGSTVGKIVLQGDNTDFQAVSFDSYEFPEPNTSIYFEMDYKCNQEFVFGLIINSDGDIATEPVMLINPIDHWNKIYIDLSNHAISYYTANNFAVFFTASKSDTVTRAEILLDNLKLLHY